MDEYVCDYSEVEKTLSNIDGDGIHADYNKGKCPGTVALYIDNPVKESEQ